MAHDVFVSHSSKDKPTADAVCAMLESQGIRCWVAPRDITPGMDWGEAIVHAVKGARVMVLVFSASANESPQIKREVERAVNKGIPVIPLRIEDVAPTASLEYFISTPHWLDAFTPPLEGHLRYLAQIIQQILGTQRATDAVGAPAVSLSGSHAMSGTPAQTQSQSADTKSRRTTLPLGLLAGAIALLAVLLAGWWFGIERPRREESRQQIEAERKMRAQAELEAARMAEEQRKMKEDIEVAKRAEERRQATEAAAKFTEERRQAEVAARIAAEQKQKEEAAARIAEEKRFAEAEAAKASAEKKAGDLVLAKTGLAQNDGAIERVRVADVPASDTTPLKKSPTVFELAKDAERYIAAQAKEKLVKVRSEKTLDELTPSTWYLVFHDTTTTFQAVEVSFRSGQMMDVRFPPDYFGSFLGIAKPQPFDKSRLKVDSDKALQMATTEPLLKNLTLKATQVWLELRNGIPVWRIHLWAASYRNPNDQADLGEIHISADEGKVVKRDLHPERVN